MRIMSHKEKIFLVVIYSLLANLIVGFVFYWLFEASSVMLLPIFFVSSPWFLDVFLDSNGNGKFVKRIYFAGIVYWIAYNILNLLVFFVYYSSKYSVDALGLVIWDETICMMLAASLLQLLIVFCIYCSKLSKQLKCGLIVLSIIMTMIVLVLFQLAVLYYNLYLGILHYVVLGAIITVLCASIMYWTITRDKKAKDIEV